MNCPPLSIAIILLVTTNSSILDKSSNLIFSKKTKLRIKEFYSIFFPRLVFIEEANANSIKNLVAEKIVCSSISATYSAFTDTGGDVTHPQRSNVALVVEFLHRQ